VVTLTEKKVMNLEELVTFHDFMLQIRQNIEETINRNTVEFFTYYDQLNINPNFFNTSIRKQHKAILELTKAISLCLSDNKCTAFNQIGQRFDNFCNRY
jgi:hypothetical protein